MRMRGIIITGVVMAVVLLLGTGFSGTVYGNVHGVNKNTTNRNEISEYEIKPLNGVDKKLLLKMIEENNYFVYYEKLLKDQGFKRATSLTAIEIKVIQGKVEFN